MPRILARRLVVFSTILGLLFLHLSLAIAPGNNPLSREVQAQGQPVINHQAIECVIANEHPVIRAQVQPSTDVQTVKVYFHAQLFSDFYFVEMTQTDDGEFIARLPIPAPDTRRFDYYIEAVNHAYNISRTAGYSPRVTGEDECDRDPAAVPPLPEIAVGSTVAGSSALPPGFLVTGVRTITSAGGGGGALTGVLIGAGAAAGGTIALVGKGDDTPEVAPPPPQPPPGPPPPPPPPEPTPNPAPSACIETEPSPPAIDVNGSVRFDGSCSEADRAQLSQTSRQQDKITSYLWNFGDGRQEKKGRVVSHLYREAGVFTVTLTVTDEAGSSDTVQILVTVIEEEEEEPPPPGPGPPPPPPPPPPTEADLALSLSVAPGAVPPELVFTITVTNLGPLDASTINLTDSITGPFDTTSIGVSFVGGFTTCSETLTGLATVEVDCFAPTMRATATFTVDVTLQRSGIAPITITSNVTQSGPPPDDPPGNNSGTLSTTNPQRAPDFGDPMETSFTSHLQVPPGDGSVRGQIVLNRSQLDETDNSAPRRHRFKGQEGKNIIEANVMSGLPGEGQWIFDLSSTPHFVPGSIKVQSGQVIAQGPDRVVFRVRSPGERIRFRLQLSP
jgi:uncharacterized repeat protein (TIGR01451 family)